MPKLLDNLAHYCNDTVISPTVQAVLVHAQFNSTRPFMDGNGPAGRVLVYLILRRRGLDENLAPPISLDHALKQLFPEADCLPQRRC